MTAPVLQYPWEVDQSSVWKSSNPRWDVTTLECQSRGEQGEIYFPILPQFSRREQTRRGDTVIMSLGGIDPEGQGMRRDVREQVKFPCGPIQRGYCPSKLTLASESRRESSTWPRFCSVLPSPGRPATERDPSGLGIDGIVPKADGGGTCAGVPHLPCPRRGRPVFLHLT